MQSHFNNSDLSTGQCATLACLLEVMAPKPGNVHRGADFEEMGLIDFAVSAAAIAPAMDAAQQQGVGATSLRATRATQQLVRTNTNLGTILLLAPMAAVPRGVSLHSGLPDVLGDLQPDDAKGVYEAIQLANPSGMGEVESMDITGTAPQDLLEAMRAASGRDLVARQYTNGFQEVLQLAAPRLAGHCRNGLALTTAIIDTHIFLMAKHPDTLIARKCGRDVAMSSAARAARVIEAGAPKSDAYGRAAGDLDFWLRSDGHRRNPGTTADLIAAGLFVGLREGWLAPPFR